MSSLMILSQDKNRSQEIATYLDAEYPTIVLMDEVPHPTAMTQVDVLILDATTFMQNTADFIMRLQSPSPFIPVIVLIEKGDVQTAVQLLRAGAADVLEIPVSKSAILKSVDDAIAYRSNPEQNTLQQAIDLLQSLRTRYGVTRLTTDTRSTSTFPALGNLLQIGELVINIDQEKVTYQRKPVDLTPTQFRMLAYLGQARGRVVPFEELYDHLHGVPLERSVARIALSAHLSNLRAHLNEVGCRDYLENIRGRGYVLDAPQRFQPTDDATE